ncbi:MAG: hypothetical protein KAR39_02950 [Thermoplasmata archaeon]|nr:hypothetical protein [Thermoplasmata archaeon]
MLALSSPEIGVLSTKKFRQWLEENHCLILGQEGTSSAQTGGYPDFMVECRGGQIVIYEVKTGSHRLDPHQEEILRIMRKLGEVYIIRYDSESTPYDGFEKDSLEEYLEKRKR